MTRSQADKVRPGHASSEAASPTLAPRSQLADLHRARILSGTARALDEHGYASTTVAMVIETAGVSRSRFYELFSGSDACVRALIDELVAYTEHYLCQRHIGELPWDERVRQGLWATLSCLEREPLLARACVVHSVGVAGATAERREQVIASLVEVVDAGREICATDQATPMTAEGVIGAAMRLVYSRLSSGHDSPRLTDLFAEMTGLILLPYLGSERTREVQQHPTPDPVTAAESRPLGGTLDTSTEAMDPLNGIAIRLTYRTARTLHAVAQQPGASNRAIANAAGIADPGQASKLLARLQRLGLITNEAVAGTKWELNSWQLTPAGNKVVQPLRWRAAVMTAETAAVPFLARAEGA